MISTGKYTVRLTNTVIHGFMMSIMTRVDQAEIVTAMTSSELPSPPPLKKSHQEKSHRLLL